MSAGLEAAPSSWNVGASSYLLLAYGRTVRGGTSDGALLPFQAGRRASGDQHLNLRIRPGRARCAAGLQRRRAIGSPADFVPKTAPPRRRTASMPARARRSTTRGRAKSVVWPARAPGAAPPPPAAVPVTRTWGDSRRSAESCASSAVIVKRNTPSAGTRKVARFVALLTVTRGSLATNVRPAASSSSEKKAVRSQLTSVPVAPEKFVRGRTSVGASFRPSTKTRTAPP